jgi:predicted nucleotidyltransferase
MSMIGRFTVERRPQASECMSRTRPRKPEAGGEAVERWYGGADVPMSAIRDYARQMVEHFQPEKVILFGSYAYGTPHAGSDVDILVIMPTRNELDQAWKIDRALARNFWLHLIVRTPGNMEWRLREGDWFLREIVARGKILYEKSDARVGRQGGRRLSGRAPARGRTRSVS